jgi:hypothetical protein
MRRALSLLAAAALVLPTAVIAHPGSTLTGYVSTVSVVVPNVLGVNALVLGGDDRLRVSNYSGKTIVILGYQGEPYLRFDKTGVYANSFSPAAHLNRFRLPRPVKPGVADPSAPPRWRRVARGVTYEWHDHRIHWTGREPPPGVREHPERIQRIFTWRVPARADGVRFAITGFLGYAPDPAKAKEDAGTSGWLLPSAIAAGVLAVGALGGMGARRARRRAP